MLDNQIIEKGVSWVTEKYPDAQNVLNQAMSIGQNGGGVKGVVGMLVQYANTSGNVHILNEFSQPINIIQTKSEDEVIPYLKSSITELNLLPKIIKRLFGG